LSTLIIAIVIITVGSGAFNTLDVFFVTQNLGAPAQFYGLIGAATALGAVIGAILARSISSTILLGGLIAITYARMTTLTPALVLVFMLGIVSGFVNVALQPLFLRVTPHHFVGRAIAVIDTASAIAQVSGTAIAGYAASVTFHNFHAMVLGAHIGPIDTIFVVAGVMFLLGGIYTVMKLGFTDPPTLEPSVTTVATEETTALASV
jgi:MFS family permease